MKLSHTVVYLSFFGALVLEVKSNEKPTLPCPTVYDPCATWLKMVSQKGRFLKDSLRCADYTNRLSPNFAMKRYEPQLVNIYQTFAEVTHVDELKKGLSGSLNFEATWNDARLQRPENCRKESSLNLQNPIEMKYMDYLWTPFQDQFNFNFTYSGNSFYIDQVFKNSNIMHSL